MAKPTASQPQNAVIDDALREFAATELPAEKRAGKSAAAKKSASRAAPTLSVIVEAATGSLVTGLRPSKVMGKYDVGAELSPPPRETHKTLDEIESRLLKLTRKTPTRLSYAEAFVLDVTPEQLREIATWPNIGKIRPNRVHHAGAAPVKS
jgi:hypothetical protein